MATCFENLVKHLKLAIRQFKQLAEDKVVDEVDVDQIEELVIEICDKLDQLESVYD